MALKIHRNRLVVDYRDPITGERVRVRVPESEATPRRAAAFEAKVRAGWRPVAESKAPTLKAFWPKFMEFQASPANKRPNRPRTLAELQRVHDLYLYAELGNTPLDRITTETVDQLAGKLAAKKLSRATIANVLGALRRMLNVAKRWGHVKDLPQIDAAKPRLANAIEPEHWLTRDEADRLVAHAGKWSLVALFMIRTGLRMGEVQGLRWSDLDLGQQRVHVRRAWSEHLGAFGSTKSGRTREVPLPADVCARLAEHVPHNPRSAELVFGAGDRPLNPTPFAKGLKRAVERAEIGKHVHPHMLRHTYASHCVAAGIPTRVVMSWGGWESESMLARYAHLAPREIEHWAARLPGAGV